MAGITVYVSETVWLGLFAAGSVTVNEAFWVPAPKASTLTVRVAEAPGARLPEAGETCAQAWLVEADQLRFFDPAAAELVKVTVLAEGAGCPATKEKLKEAGFKLIVADGWAPTETLEVLVSTPPGPLHDKV